MAILLPALAFLLLIVLIGTVAPSRSDDSAGWEMPFLLAAPLWGGVLVAILELLGSMSAIRQGPLAVAWLLVDVALLGGLRLAVGRRGWKAIWRPPRPRLSSGEWVFLAILGALLLGLFVVALVAPANNPDSQLYHMARVVHWAQNGSLRHYGTAYGHQLWNPPWAELAILNARVLWGNDRLSNLIQWAALVGCLVGVSAIGRNFGLDRRRRMLAVGFAASIPMAVLQATSTQNDLVTAFWLVVVAALILRVRKSAMAGIEIASLGLAIGLGMLTKGTFYVFVVPFLVWFVATRSWKVRPRRALIDVVLVAGLATLPNLGHWGRNLAVAGSPLGPSEWVGAHGALSRAILVPSGTVLVSRPLQGLVQHFATPWTRVNDTIAAALQTSFATPGVGFTSAVWGWNHEDLAGSPLHLFLAALTSVLLVLSFEDQRKDILELGACALAASYLMALLLPPSLTTVGVRLHTSLILIWAPVFASVVGGRLQPRTSMVAGGLMLVLGFPWMLFNTTRPLIGMQLAPASLEIPCTDTFGCTAIGSVLAVPRTDILFASLRGAQEDYETTMDTLRSSACRSVGLRIDSSDREYVTWYLLDAPQSGFHLETIYTTPSLEALLDHSYQPCAIICTICGDRTRLHGLGLAAGSGPVKLFLGDGFTWDEDG